ncbi:MAG: TSUP family transporter [Bacteroidia bacterium]
MLGVFLTEYIPTHIFSFVFGIILLLLAIFLFVRTKPQKTVTDTFTNQPHLTERTLTDKHNVTYHYAYNKYVGILISIMVGFISPLLGIGGGIIHVPAMGQLAEFPCSYCHGNVSFYSSDNGKHQCNCSCHKRELCRQPYFASWWFGYVPV